MKIRYLALLGLVVLAGCGKEQPYQLSTQESQTAEIGARRFFDSLGADFVGCSGQDSPPVDGYVTCTGKIKQTQQISSAVCSYANSAAGCKMK